ncbi:MAG: hypothetical protein GY861_00880 [bacterium]|nr:hypothetical protein [bacterium]
MNIDWELYKVKDKLIESAAIIIEITTKNEDMWDNKTLENLWWNIQHAIQGVNEARGENEIRNEN